MGEISAKDTDGLEDTNTSMSGAPITAAMSQSLGQSNPIEYTPPTPEPLDIGQRLERGFMRTVESAPQMIGQGLYYLGSNFNPEQTKDQVEKGSSFGDRMAQMGLLMTERNQQAMAEKFPEKPDWIENIAGAGPMVGGIVLGTLAGAPLEAGAGLAVGSGIAMNNSAFQTLRGQGKSMNESVALAAAVGMTGAATMMIGVGNFLKAVGAPVAQFAKGIVNGFTGGILQSGANSAAEMATGVNPDHSPEAIKKAIGDAVATGVTFAVWGGPLGVHQALIQHDSVQKGIEQLGYSKSDAQAMTTKMMSQGMEIGIKQAEALVKADKDQSRRMKIIQLMKNKPIDGNGTPRTDILDEPFVPTEPSKTEALTAELESKKRSLEMLKTDVTDLKEGITELEDVQQKARDRIAAGLETQAENVRSGHPLDSFEIAKLEQARQHLEEAQKDAEKLKDQIETIKEKLQPKINPIQELTQQIARMKQGFRAGEVATIKDAEFVQKEFNRLIDQSDLDLADKAKFRKSVPLTVENFEKELPSILNKMQQLEEHAEQKNWIKDIKKIDLDKLPIEARDHLEHILKAFDFGFPSKAKIMGRESTRAYFEKVLGNMEPDMISYEKDENGVFKPVYRLTPGEQKALEDARQLSIPELLREPNGHERLRSIYNQIMTIYHEGKMAGKYFSNLKIRNHEAWKEKFIQNLMGSATTSKLSTFEKSLALKNQNAFQKLWGWKNAVFTAEMHSDMLFHLIGADEEHQLLHESYQQRIELQRQNEEDLSKIHQRAEVGEAYKEKHDISIEVGGEARTFKGVTGSQLLKTYAQSFEEKSLAHIENTFKRPGDTQDVAKQTVRELLKYTAKEYPEQTKAIIKQFDYFRTKGYDDLDRVVVDMTGHHMTKVHFYDPLIGLEDRSGQEIQNDMKLGVKGMQQRAEVASGFTKARVKSELAIKNLDYYGDLMKNSIARANYITMARTMRDLNTKFYDPQVVSAIRDKMGNEAVNTLHGLLRELASGGANHYSTIDRTLSYLRTSFIVSKIGLNPWSVGKVSAQLSPASDYVGKLWVQKAVPDYLMNRAKYDVHIDENSLMMKNMYLRQERDMENLIHTGGGSDLGPVKARDEIAKLSMWGHLQMDMIVRRATWLAQETKMKSEVPNATRDEINAAADAAVRWTHPMGGTLYLPAAFRGNEFQKAITTFHSATNRNFNLLMKANIDLGEKSITPLRWASKQLGIGIIPALIVSALSLHRKPTARELALEYINQTTGSEVYLGWATNAMMSGREASVTSPFADLVNSGGEAITEKNSRGKVQHGLSATDDLLKTPLSNAFRDAMMVLDLAQGKFKGEPHRGFMHELDNEDHSNSGDTDNPYGSGRI